MESELTLDEKVRRIIDSLRPNLQMDGGDIEFLGMDGSYAKVRLQGACASCPSSIMTLKMGIERILKQEIPEFSGVIQG